MPIDGDLAVASANSLRQPVDQVLDGDLDVRGREVREVRRNRPDDRRPRRRPGRSDSPDLRLRPSPYQHDRRHRRVGRVDRALEGRVELALGTVRRGPLAIAGGAPMASAPRIATITASLSLPATGRAYSDHRAWASVRATTLRAPAPRRAWRRPPASRRSSRRRRRGARAGEPARHPDPGRVGEPLPAPPAHLTAAASSPQAPIERQPGPLRRRNGDLLGRIEAPPAPAPGARWRGDHPIRRLRLRQGAKHRVGRDTG